MFDFLAKFIFFFLKPQIIVVCGNGRQTAAEAIFRVLHQNFKGVKKAEKIFISSLLKNKIFIYETDLKNEVKKIKFFLRTSKLPILIVTQVGDIPPEREFFAGELEKAKEIIKLAETLPIYGYLILNFDDETVRDIKNKSNSRCFTFGFGSKADFRASDIVITEKPAPGTNFKVNYKGNIIPVWLKQLFGKEQIYASLAATAVGEILGLNLVKVSESLKFYKSLPGKMRLIEGVKNSWILDDSESATVFSMMEALKIMKEIKAKRKIAVLGDILGIGKYSIEAHEAIGEKVKTCADLLFTVGLRAKFIAQGAISKGMPKNQIFQFDRTFEVGKILENKIQEGDLILIDGSKEMKMSEIVKEIQAIK